MRTKPISANNLLLLSDSELSLILNAAPLSSGDVAAFVANRSVPEQERVLRVLIVGRRARVTAILRTPQTITVADINHAARRIDAQLRDLVPDVYWAFSDDGKGDFAEQRRHWRNNVVARHSAYPTIALPPYEPVAPVPPILTAPLDEVPLSALEEYLETLWHYLEAWGPQPLEAVRAQFDPVCWACVMAPYDDSLTTLGARKQLRKCVTTRVAAIKRELDIAREFYVLTRDGVDRDPSIFALVGIESPEVIARVCQRTRGVGKDAVRPLVEQTLAEATNAWELMAIAYFLQAEHGALVYFEIAEILGNRIPWTLRMGLEFGAMLHERNGSPLIEELKKARTAHWESIARMFEVWFRRLRGEFQPAAGIAGAILRMHSAGYADEEALDQRRESVRASQAASVVKAITGARTGLPGLEVLAFADDERIKKMLVEIDWEVLATALTAMSERITTRIFDNMSSDRRGRLQRTVAARLGAVTIGQIWAAQREMIDVCGGVHVPDLH